MTAAVSALDAPPVERQLAFDMAKRGLPVAPILVAVAGAIWGWAGAASAAFAVALVLLNFAVAAVSLSWAGKRSIALLMGVSLFGYIFRLALITVAVLAVKDQSWVKLVPLGLTLIVTHLGLLFWEAKHVSVSLAFPALTPQKKGI
ncbi:MAG: hypothetical protein QOG03_1472 [Actinomycetota bacterium]|nr:hypothetical protein [Actinomycetota bacterium]